MIYLAQIPDVTTFALPSWCDTDAAHAFFLGMAFAVVVRVLRVCIKWFKRVGNEGGPSSE